MPKGGRNRDQSATRVKFSTCPCEGHTSESSSWGARPEDPVACPSPAVTLGPEATLGATVFSKHVPKTQHRALGLRASSLHRRLGLPTSTCSPPSRGAFQSKLTPQPTGRWAPPQTTCLPARTREGERKGKEGEGPGLQERPQAGQAQSRAPPVGGGGGGGGERQGLRKRKRRGRTGRKHKTGSRSSSRPAGSELAGLVKEVTSHVNAEIQDECLSITRDLKNRKPKACLALLSPRCAFALSGRGSLVRPPASHGAGGREGGAITRCGAPTCRW